MRLADATHLNLIGYERPFSEWWEQQLDRNYLRRRLRFDVLQKPGAGVAGNPGPGT